MGRTRLLAGAAAFLTFAAGCESTPATGVDAAPANLAPVQWPYWPDTMRFHPLTRLLAVEQGTETLIEARVEFVDRDRMTTRCFGEMHIDLFTGAFGEATFPERSWDVDLLSLDANANHFDEVTRTYLFRLRLDHPPPDDGRLRARFSGADEQELSARFTLPPVREGEAVGEESTEVEGSSDADR